MRGVLRVLSRGAQVVARGPVTVHYPYEKKQLPKRARTFPYLIWNHDLDETNCTGCGKCATACPVDCMTTTLQKNPGHAAGTSNHKSLIKDFYIDFGRCMRCNICVEVCPFDAIAMLPQWEGHEQTTYDRHELIMDLDDLLAPQPRRPQPAILDSRDDPREDRERARQPQGVRRPADQRRLTRLVRRGA